MIIFKQEWNIMSAAVRVEVKKEIYKWAINESQRDYHDISKAFKNIDDWINQHKKPTFRQLQDLSKFLGVPFGYMFLKRAPEKNVIQADYRTLSNKKPNMSKNLIDTITDMSAKQNWVSEYRKTNGWNMIIGDSYENLHTKEFAKKAKSFLTLDEKWFEQQKNTAEAFKYLRNMFEENGILVMQNGIVKLNTNRKLSLDEFRGFFLYDEYAPLIFLNSNDSYAGKIFTLIHELIHLLLKKDDIFENIDLHATDDDERYINQITAEFLMPEALILEYWNTNKQNIEQIEEISSLFKVSRHALSIRLYELKLINRKLKEEIEEITENDIRNFKSQKGGGGNFWTSYKSRFSHNFIEAVVNGTESGDISYTRAFNLLNIKANRYDNVKELLENYE